MNKPVEYLRYGTDVRVTARPDARGSFRIRYQDPRTGLHKDARRSSWPDAEALALELSGGLARLKAGTPTLGDSPMRHLLEDHLADKAGRYKRQTLRSARAMVNRHIAPAVGGLACSAWDVAVTRQIVDAARERGLADSTLNGVVRLLGGIAKTGRELGYLPAGHEPTKGVRVGSSGVQVDLTDLPTADEVEKLAGCFVEVTGQEWRRLQVYLCAYSGLRAGEMLGLLGSDFALDKGELRVERQLATTRAELIPPKYGSVRVVPWPAWMDELVSERVAEVQDGPLFPGTKADHEPYSTFRSERFVPARERARWPRAADGKHRWTLHTLRHYFCTWALSSDGLGLDVADVQRFAGHRDPTTTWQVYVQSRPDRVSRAREASRSAAR